MSTDADPDRGELFAVLLDDAAVETLHELDHSVEECLDLLALMDDVPWHWLEEGDDS
jgi:hypothetical protein